MNPYTDNDNEDRLIQQMFDDFNPELSSDCEFMKHLQRTIEAVETVKKQNIADRRRSRIAAVAAGITGMITGMLFMLLLPAVGEWCESVRHMAAFLMPQFPLLTDNIPSIMSWAITTVVTSVTAYNTYHLTMASLTRR